MSLVSSSSAGTWRADRALRMAPLIFVASSAPKAFPGAIFRKRMTRSSPSALYWGTQRLSDTSSKDSTTEGEGWSSREGRSVSKGGKCTGGEEKGPVEFSKQHPGTFTFSTMQYSPSVFYNYTRKDYLGLLTLSQQHSPV